MENIPLFIGSYTSQVPGGAGFPPSTDVGCGSQRPLRSQLKVFFPKNANRSETTNHRSFLVTKKRRLFWTYPVQITGNCKCFKVLWLWRFCGMYLSILEKYTVYLYYIYICIYETVIYININMSRYIYILYFNMNGYCKTYIYMHNMLRSKPFPTMYSNSRIQYFVQERNDQQKNITDEWKTHFPNRN